ncbi:polysaccharide deacetylase [Vibrio splendidus]|uniref:polysaccharide deacetylase family protein n=1 Tax=Vibrio splendidus TaxID=29497 RepID=UPI000D3659E9|nr:polysaccharide deacetylase family protein [Vibrio splendidus]PTO51483.1 polysaccharide deacetylase [Vibrio splendidus]
MGSFIISLDFELLWGVRDSRGSEYHKQLLNVHKVVPHILSLFERYGIACTWATVGALCVSSEEELYELKPTATPTYDDSIYSPYENLDTMLALDPRMFFASRLVQQIVHTPKQELASHTFCHYYCLEKGQSIEQFKADLNSNLNAVKKFNTKLKSLVFPRNQFNKNYLSACKELGIICYRGNPEHWAYRAESRNDKGNSFRRIFRLLDSYLPLSGSLQQKPTLDLESSMINIPASLFLRPFSKRLFFLEPIRLWRIKWSMTQAAKNGGVFHLWWHPHNFGSNLEENFSFLEEILKHYKYLNCRYGFDSITMENKATDFLIRKGVN